MMKGDTLSFLFSQGMERPFNPCAGPQCDEGGYFVFSVFSRDGESL